MRAWAVKDIKTDQLLWPIESLKEMAETRAVAWCRMDQDDTRYKAVPVEITEITEEEGK